ncbi:MAG: hypothetical protein FD138_1858 [Planctomycetota bacterium]|nr:MAG: hypothetical protein FD138_1858 [Planctomycetota bacterium]
MLGGLSCDQVGQAERDLIAGPDDAHRAATPLDRHPVRHHAHARSPTQRLAESVRRPHHPEGQQHARGNPLGQLPIEQLPQAVGDFQRRENPTDFVVAQPQSTVAHGRFQSGDGRREVRPAEIKRSVGQPQRPDDAVLARQQARNLVGNLSEIRGSAHSGSPRGSATDQGTASLLSPPENVSQRKPPPGRDSVSNWESDSARCNPQRERGRTLALAHASDYRTSQLSQIETLACPETPPAFVAPTPTSGWSGEGVQPTLAWRLPL